MTRGHIYDLVAAWAVRLNSDSQATGQLDPDGAEMAGDDPVLSPAFLLRGPMTLKTAKGTRSTVEFRGGGRPEGKRQSGLDTIGDAELVLSQWDNGANAFMNNGLVDTTSLSGAEISAQNNMNPAPNVVAFCGISRIDRTDSIKAVEYKHFIYPNCQMSSDDPDTQQVDGNQKNPNPVTVKVTPSVADHFPNGVAFGANQGWYQNTEFGFTMTSPFPYFTDVWVADGSATTFDLTYLPKYSDVTGGNTKNWVTKNGVPTAPTSISTTTGAVVIPAAGSAGDLWVVQYMVDPRLLV